MYKFIENCTLYITEKFYIADIFALKYTKKNMIGQDHILLICKRWRHNNWFMSIIDHTFSC